MIMIIIMIRRLIWVVVLAALGLWIYGNLMPRDPLRGVEALAIEGAPDGDGASSASASESEGWGPLRQYLEVTLEERGIRVVSRGQAGAEAEAILRLRIDEFTLDGRSLRLKAHGTLTTAQGETRHLLISLIVDERGVRVEIKEKRFWPFWT